jgi:predicted glycosyltransferase
MTASRGELAGDDRAGRVADPRVWIDLASPSHPVFFKAIADGLDLPTVVTAREKTETVPLAREAGFEFTVRGRDFDGEWLRTLGVPLRTLQLAARTPDADVSLSQRNAMCVLASKAHDVPSIHFTDNDITYFQDTPLAEVGFNYFRAMATAHVVPEAFQLAELTDYGASRDSIFTYDGFKEEVCVADFEPDPDFTDRLPFEEYVVLRPEAIGAAYVDLAPENSLVPQFLDRAVAAGLNVVYLPRRPDDRAHAAPYPADRVFVPGSPLPGLQLAWHADCTLTGSGTMGREAAAMRKPAVSFFPHTMLSVDQQLVEEGRIVHSRDPDAIVDYLTGLSRSAVEPDLDRAKRVRDEVVEITGSVIDAVV